MEFFKALGWDEVDNDYEKKISDKSVRERFIKKLTNVSIALTHTYVQ